MGRDYASGHWHVRPGEADVFVERWTEFLGWTRDNEPGLESATLIRSLDDPQRFVSFAVWSSADARDGWKASDGFRKRFMACRELCDDFIGGDYDEAVAV